MYAGVGWRGRFWKVPEAESSGVCWCRFRRQDWGKVPACWWQGCEGSGRFPCGLLPCNLDRSSRVLVLITGITLSTWAKRRPYSQRWHKA